MYLKKLCKSEALISVVILTATLSLARWVEGQENRGKTCTFDSYIVNSVTVTSLLPETGFCDTVSGSLRIDETTNLTHQQLSDALGRVGLVMGNVAIVNTAFTNLSFFSELYAVTGSVDGLDVQREEIEDRVCRIGNVTNVSVLPDDCHTLVGDLTIDEQSRPEDFWKLYNVTRIYGGLTIRNSSLKSFSPLWQLNGIYSFAEDQSALVIESNAVLKSAYFGVMERMMSYLPCSIAENPALSISEHECGLLNTTTADRVNFRGNKDDCPGKRGSAGSIVEYIHIPVLLLALY
ncbi:hypothetical protein Y032_0023g768 [Ancylostoma ceylanicum]|uniref:Receptor L-domain domain-containing protein n=1 Tax=Ancylostoma ceylanicum TaxID=53326 RepID=A0A016UXG3_9BILA|nr:hypothetical protein Y032_0023g768 [Ancylostoma ceylanicum]